MPDERPPLVTGPPRPVRLVLACGLVELLSWGSLYYAVPILYDRVNADTGWSVLALTATYSGSLVVAALLGPRIGGVVDRHGPRHLVVAGAAVGSAGLTVAAAAPVLPLFVLGVLVSGVGQAATLYPPVFAALTIWFGDRRARALTVVSLFGGASSAVFAPVLAPAAEGVGWRPALLAVAVVNVLVTAPVAWWGLRAPWPVAAAAPADPARRDRHRHRGITRSGRYRALQLSMMLAGLGLYAATLNLVPLVREQGHSYSFAATAFALVGAGQVAGRLAYLPLATWGSPRTRTLLQVGAAALATAALGVAGGTTAVVVAALAAGAVRGAHTLVMTIGLADRWGSDGFGALSGHFNRPVALAIAAAPFTGSALATATGSYATAALVLGAVVGLGLVAGARAT